MLGVSWVMWAKVYYARPRYYGAQCALCLMCGVLNSDREVVRSILVADRLGSTLGQQVTDAGQQVTTQVRVRGIGHPNFDPVQRW